MSSKTHDSFDALRVALEGSNLIEASAGTGKTYSIAVLVLRLIVEKGISIREILMVTFTNAAVAELEERVRLFVRTALRAAEDLPVKDSNIAGLVEAASLAHGKETVLQRLQDAVLFLDEASIMTIHSFCQNVLNEFAFETQQLFGMELQANADVLIEES
jgi:exodeoxyribonuclease V beta subunit